MRRTVLGSAVAMVIATLAATGCGAPATRSTSGPTTSGPTTSTAPAPVTSIPSATTVAPTTTVASSAAQDLAPLLTAAAAADAALAKAAALINADIGPASFRFRSATVAAVKAVPIDSVAAAIPAGLDPPLLQRALLVYSDLESRRSAMNRVFDTAQHGSDERKDLMMCLANGAKAAARYPADLAGLGTAALAAPRVTSAAAESRAAAEVALRVEEIGLGNNGCGSCGGYIATTLAPIVWHPEDIPDIGHRDGTIDAIQFTATYRAGRGWDVLLYAC